MFSSFVAHFQALIADSFGILALFQVLIADSFGILALFQVLIEENFGILELFQALIADNFVILTHMGKKHTIQGLNHDLHHHFSHTTNCATNSLILL